MIELADASMRRIYERNPLLARPDPRVAWRGNDIPDDPARLAAASLGHRIHERRTPPMSDPIRDPEVQALLDKQAITEALMRYSRGMDRHDRGVLESAYWPDAIDDHITYSGEVAGFFDYAFAFTKDMRTSHMLLNILIELESPIRARSETYYIGYHDLPGAVGREDFVMGGRYLDLFEKRGPEWRIAKRVLTCDWYTRAPSTSAWGTGILAQLKTRGEHYPHDPLYNFFDKK